MSSFVFSEVSGALNYYFIFNTSVFTLIRAMQIWCLLAKSLRRHSCTANTCNASGVCSNADFFPTECHFAMSASLKLTREENWCFKQFQGTFGQNMYCWWTEELGCYWRWREALPPSWNEELNEQLRYYLQGSLWQPPVKKDQQRQTSKLHANKKVSDWRFSGSGPLLCWRTVLREMEVS